MFFHCIRNPPNTISKGLERGFDINSLHSIKNRQWKTVCVCVCVLIHIMQSTLLASARICDGIAVILEPANREPLTADWKTGVRFTFVSEAQNERFFRPSNSTESPFITSLQLVAGYTIPSN